MKKEKLINICTPRQWKTLSTSELMDKGYPVYGANGIIGYYDSYNHESETVMVTCRGATCGMVNLSEPFSYINGNAMCMDDVRDDVDTRYLYYALKQYDFKNIISGSAQPQITRQGLSKVYISITNKEKQLEIVESLSKVEQLLDNKKLLLLEYDQLIKSRFVEMFGDTKTNSKKLPLVKPEEICESISAGGDRPDEVSSIKTTDFAYPIFSNGEKDDGLYGWSKEYRIEKPSVTVSGRGTIGYSSYRKDGKFTPIVRLIVMTPNEKVNPVYLTYYLNLEREEGSGSGVQQLTVPMIKSKKIMLPELIKQNKFAEFVEQVDKLKFEVQKSLDESQMLFDSLMQEYFG